MKEIIQWLLEVEHAAGAAYSNARKRFNDDPEFKKFLEANIEDEAWHYHVMASASAHLRRVDEEVPAIVIDEEINQKILGTLAVVNQRLADKSLTKKEFLQAMATTELSEWNDIFIYVVEKLKTSFREFSVVTPKIQSHRRAIEVYLEEHIRGSDKISTLKALPKIWEEKILIVEDDRSVSDLFKAILQNEGHVDTADNGKQGYARIEKKYYKLIICDIDMPVMDGISLYNIVKNLYPDIGDRFLFITGNVTPERKTFFDQNQLAYLEKPASLSQIRHFALDILLTN